MKYLIKGIVGRLTSFAGVTALVGQRTYTHVPQKTTFPFLSLDIEGQEADTKTSNAALYRVVVNVWDRSASIVNAVDIMAAVKSALHRQESNITMDFNTLVMLQLVAENCFLDADGVTWHGVLEFEALVQF